MSKQVDTLCGGHPFTPCRPRHYRLGVPATRPLLRFAVAASLAGKAAELVTLVALATLVPRSLGAVSYGHFALGLNLVTLTALAMTLGGPTLMARYVPAAAPADRIGVALALTARQARTRAAMLGGAALLTAAVVTLGAWNAGSAALLFTALVLNVGATLALQLALGLGRAGAWSARYPLQNAVLVGGVLVLEPWLGRVGGSVAILASAAVAAAFAAVVALPLAAGSGPPGAVPDGALRFGALQAVGAAASQVCHRGGVLVVGLLAGDPSEAGFAAVAAGLALGASYAVLQAFTVSLPHVVDAGDEGEATLRRLAGGLLGAVLPGALLAAVLAERVVPGLFGSDFAGAADSFGPALATVVLAPLAALAVQVSALRLVPAASSRGGLWSLGTFAVAVAVLVPRLDAVGATLATFLAVATGTAVALRSLPGAASTRLVALSFGGAAIVATVGLA
jgi:O-antigen/teichoic acid export membrane protein